MRLLSATVRSYRIHQNLTVKFDSARNLIGGPNETGKSTLAEAIHRALFMRHRAGGEIQQSMVSTLGGSPAVTLVFEARGGTWTLEKEFAGARGSVRLRSDTGEMWQGDAAEEKLSTLIGNTDGMANRANDLATRWSHLWVWQGTAGADAAAHAASRRDELVQRLQEQGLAAVMQSETDERARESIRVLHDGIFTSSGAVKAGSRLDRALRDVAAAEQALAQATATKERLKAAVDDLESAANDLRDVEAHLPAARESLATTRANQEKAKALSQEKERQQLLVDQATRERAMIEAADQRIREIAAKITTLRQELVPVESGLSRLDQREKAARQAADAAEAALREIASSLRLARQQCDLAHATTARLEKQAARDELSAKAAQIRVVEQALATQREALAKLPAITQQTLDELRALESSMAQAQSAVDAIATGIECVTSGIPVGLNEELLSPGETRVITETTELRIGDGTLLRIRPGGGTTLADSLRKISVLSEQFRSRLDRLAIRNMAEAVETVARRQSTELEISKIESELKALGAAKLPAALEAAKTELAAAVAECQRRQEALAVDGCLATPDTLAAARTRHQESAAVLRQAEEREQALAAAAETRRKEWKGVDLEFQSAKAALEKATRQLDELATQQRLLEEQHGSAAERMAALDQARHAEQQARVALGQTSSQLDALRPESLAYEVTRLQRVIDQLEHKRQDAEKRRAAAEALLAQDGTRDPDADLLQARARHAAALDVRDREQRHADAIGLLHRLFNESQAAISASVTQPIADRIAGYLECLFGRGVRVDVELKHPNASSIRLTRPGEPSFAFDSLSGGAREQVAAAVRLATAEILAVHHDHCLPIVFDDAFAYADPTRVQALQSMLDLAASRGLQVIVLTCAPADYLGLGAKETLLTHPGRGSC